MFASAESKKRMAVPGTEPNCLLDAWVQEMVNWQRYEEAKASGQTYDGSKPTVNREYSDHEIAMVLLRWANLICSLVCILR